MIMLKSENHVTVMYKGVERGQGRQINTATPT